MAENRSATEIDRCVLVVEDEPRMREMLVRALRGMEFEAEGAPTAEAALVELAAGERGILLVDLNLPGMGGLEFIEQVHGRWPHTQAVILTGYGSLEAAKTAIRLDVADFLTKPCPLGDLEAALDRALRRRRAGILARPLPDLSTPGGTPPIGEHPATLRELERRHILDALDRHAGNRQAAAEELGISVRTLYYRLREYDRDVALEEEREEGST